ncbi:immunoglobulin superfamily member 2-like [Chiloscyllium punctatum]|uniref:immunoglobulin superfamily member 2-like n=1 Tax=Chiloscyllium punctatum TaxID=137246 RepID=UPI003B639CBF
MISGTLLAVILSLCVTFGANVSVLLQSPSLERVTKGHTARLRCTMRNAAVTHIDVHWYRLERRIKVVWILTYDVRNITQRYPGFTERFQPSRDPSSNSFILTISNVRPRDTGVYYCMVSDNVPGTGSQLIVDIANPVVLLQSPSLKHVIRGHTARLQCIMRNAAVKHTTVKWDKQKPGSHYVRILTHGKDGSTQWSPGFTERFQPSRDSSSNSFILTITNVQPNDTAVYYCSVRGSIYGRGSRIIVNRANPPVLLQSPSLEWVTEGQTAHLQCIMRNASVTDTTVKWYHQKTGCCKVQILTHSKYGSTQWSPGFSERIQSSRDPSNNSFILTITNVQPTDAGVYYCSVWRKIYGRGSQLNIISVNPPVLLQSPSLECVTEGHSAQLQCTMRNASVTHTDVHWDRERPGNNTEWVLTHDVRNITQWSPGFTERFQSTRDPSSNSFILTITNVQPNDAGVYYCKVWEDISGNGTRLTVMGTVLNPAVVQFPTVQSVREGQTVRMTVHHQEQQTARSDQSLVTTVPQEKKRQDDDSFQK